MPKAIAFGLEAEPVENHREPTPQWHAVLASRPGLKVKNYVPAIAGFEKERAERPKRSTKQSASKSHFVSHGDATPPIAIRYRWPETSRTLSPEADALHDEYMRRKLFVYGVALGHNVEASGERFLMAKRAKAYRVVKELEPHGGFHHEAAGRWFQAEAMALIESGNTPHGRECIPDNLATPFFRSLTGGRYAVDRWLRELGPRVKVDHEELEASLARLGGAAREGIEYLIQARIIWECYG